MMMVEFFTLKDRNLIDIFRHNSFENPFKYDHLMVMESLKICKIVFLTENIALTHRKIVRFPKFLCTNISIESEEIERII